MVPLPRSYLGPIIKAHRGEKVRIRFRNDTAEKSIVHWHGLHVPAIMDGHPRHVVSQGESYFYEFEVKNRAGTYWYHPHRQHSGRSDWRLPKREELFSLISHQTINPCIPEHNPFQKVHEGYWSATTSLYEPRYAWVLYPKNGDIGVGYKPQQDFYLLAIR